MTTVQAIDYALDLLSLTDDAFYCISYYPNSQELTLQGNYQSHIVGRLSVKGFNLEVDTRGYVTATLARTDSTPKVKVVFT